jgi:hypothetical protein
MIANIFHEVIFNNIIIHYFIRWCMCQRMDNNNIITTIWFQNSRYNC